MPHTVNDFNEGPWSSISLDIMYMILQFLPLLDCIRVSRVCKNWRSMVTSLHQIGMSSFGPPCLLYCGADDNTCTVFDPIHNENITVRNSEFVGARVCFARDGWLLMSRYVDADVVDMFFLNPLTRAKINLPSMNRDLDYGFSFSNVPTSPDCVVVSITSGVEEVEIKVCRRGDEDWSVSHEFSNIRLMITNPVYHGGSFYTLSHDGDIGIFNLEENTWTVVSKPEHIGIDKENQFLVESSGGLLVVYDLKKSVEVYRFDPNERKWVEVENLDNQVLFLGMLVSTSASAVWGITHGRIYFNRLKNGNCTTYSLESHSFHPEGNPILYKEFQHGVWIVLERSLPSPEALQWCKRLT